MCRRSDFVIRDPRNPYKHDEFLAHHHQRSNVESTFSAIKRKFGDSIRSRTPAAMANEVLCELVCHNLCCVILSQCELVLRQTRTDG